MKHSLDSLLTGHLSRRELGLILPALGASIASAAQQPPAKKQKKSEDEDVVFSPENIGGGGRIERNFYRNWTKTTKVPSIEGYSILDACTQEVRPWPEIGGRGLYLNFSGNVHMDAVIYEIAPGKALVPRSHFYEQLLYGLVGHGHTTFGDGPRQNKVEWGEGSLFSVPMNVLHRHHNSDSQKPARLLAVTTFPFMLQIFGNMGLINDTRFSFNDRYSGDADYFTRSDRVRKRWDRTNFVRDIRSSDVVAWEERGKGNASMFWDMGGNTVLEPHMSEFPVGTYKLGHRHPYEAIILTLNGKGFTLFGKEHLKNADSMKLGWQAGSIVSPPYFWFHQHFNTGSTKARYFAVTEGDFPKRIGIPLEVEQIEARQEDPEIRKRFEQEMHKAGAALHKHSHDHPG